MEKPQITDTLGVTPGFLVARNTSAKTRPQAVFYTIDKASDMAARVPGLHIRACWLLVLTDGRVMILRDTEPLVPEIDLVEDEKRRKEEAWAAAARKLTPEERELLKVEMPEHLRPEPECEEEPDPEDDFEGPPARKMPAASRDRKPARGNP